MPKDTIYVEETITHSQALQQHLPWTDPQSYFRVGGGLGQGTGYALGVKLAAQNRPVALVVGDGSFLYNPVVQALGASKNTGLPITIFVMNNRKYAAMQKGHLHHYPDGVALGADIYHGVHIDGPDYAELASPSASTARRSRSRRNSLMRSAMRCAPSMTANPRSSTLC